MIHPSLNSGSTPQEREWRTVSLLVLLSILLLIGCKEKPDPQPQIDYADGVLIINEGNFQGGNASLSFLRRGDDSLVHNIFTLENARPLGDVAQSITVIGNRAYIVVNHSGKIEVVDLPSLESRCTLTGMQSPRYLLPIGGGRALVTDLYSKTLHIVNLEGCRVESTIATGGWTEEMALLDSRVFVTQMGTDQVLVIDPITRSLVDSFPVGREPNSLAVDRDGKLWVLCGNALGQALPRLVRVNVDSLAVEAIFPFTTLQESPMRLRINATGDTLYYLNGGIYRMGIGDAGLPTQPWVAQGTHTWYGLGIDPVTGYLYASDALDYQRRGMVYRFSPQNSAALAVFEAGIIPGGFTFLH